MDYTFEFTDLSDDYERVKVVHHSRRRRFEVQVHVDDKSFVQTAATECPSVYADMIDLATALYVADRLAPRKQAHVYNIYVTLPLRNPNLFAQSGNLSALCRLLKWYTLDQWHFEFPVRTRIGREVERQPRLLPWSLLNRNCEVALWSGGLDSLAGLCSRVDSCAASHYTLLGSGSSNQIFGCQHEVLHGLKSRYNVPMTLIQVPIRLKYPSGDLPKNDASRVRGLVFMLLGAMCALMEEQQVLHIYENGFGAFNLPFMLSEIGLAHTRAVHPRSLIETAVYINQLLNTSFRFENPFLFTTKAQMCKPLIDKTDLAFRTITCDGRYRQENQPSQCGYCSSCLLRRVALLNAIGRDETEYVVTHGMAARSSSNRFGHFDRMQYQVDRLRCVLNSSNPWEQMLKRHPELMFTVEEIAVTQRTTASVVTEQLVELYRWHVDEWRRAQPIIEATLRKPELA